MKRYRILSFDFDSRPSILEPISEEWEDSVKEAHRLSQANIIENLQKEYGTHDFNKKLNNFVELGSKPLSVVAFHNEFLAQVRHSFVHGQYYPALTAICALGERVLNHLVINLRSNYSSHPLYRKVYRKDSFDDWHIAIDALSQWGVLTPEAEDSFRSLVKKRNHALHFNPDVENTARLLALEAIKTFERIVAHQFSSFSNIPWLLNGAGECFIKKEWENNPFVRLVYLPNSVYVGYKHTVTQLWPLRIEDNHKYSDQEIIDEEYLRLRAE